MSGAVFAFDCDGTLEPSAGPVRIAQLEALRDLGAVIVVVSPSPACSALWLRFRSVQGDPRAADQRLDALLRVRSGFPGAPSYTYVSDNPGDDARAAAARFRFERPEEFARKL